LMQDEKIDDIIHLAAESHVMSVTPVTLSRIFYVSFGCIGRCDLKSFW
jgi:hypothetical protein